MKLRRLGWWMPYLNIEIDNIILFRNITLIPQDLYILGKVILFSLFEWKLNLFVVDITIFLNPVSILHPGQIKKLMEDIQSPLICCLICK